MEEKVIIIGAGAGGLATALFLKKAGIESEVFEGASFDRESGAGFVLTPNGLNVLETLGITKISEYSFPLESETTYTSNNKELASATAVGNDFFSKSFITISRQNLMELLLEKAEEYKVPVHYNKKLVNFEDNSDSITAFFSDGSKVKGEILVGADGIHSKTREIIFPQVKPVYTGYYGIHGLVSSANVKQSINTKGNAYIDFDNYLGTFVSKCSPGSDSDILWQFIGKEERKIPATELELADNEFIKNWLSEKISGWDNPFKELLNNTENITSRNIFELEELPHWYHGRVTFVGDALHATNPMLGIGASWALEDGMYLAKMLREHGYRDAFYYFENDRKPLIDPVRKAASKALDQIVELKKMANTIYDNRIEW
ncbi:FAD-dependent monooxygenase [Evansella sp. LMS18]|uniref:FAD-dependent monooxygenase n=1 Tax=Evansella sp. LMS18 TaxID=2924033 RepID=UPI0020D04A6F|nr:FAD-dependent monooxygenase [Evansella sp. LMS18]UTR10239.1 FAD-dependent monooxygenase [Evansella sp. LMS18]